MRAVDRTRLHWRTARSLHVRLDDASAADLDIVRADGLKARDGPPVLDDGRDLEVTNVIWCTGFVPDFAWIDLPVLADDGHPVPSTSDLPVRAARLAGPARA